MVFGDGYQCADGCTRDHAAYHCPVRGQYEQQQGGSEHGSGGYEPAAVREQLKQQGEKECAKDEIKRVLHPRGLLAELLAEQCAYGRA